MNWKPLLTTFSLLCTELAVSSDSPRRTWEDIAGSLRTAFELTNRESIINFATLGDRTLSAPLGLTIDDTTPEDWRRPGPVLTNVRYLRITTASKVLDDEFFDAIARYPRVEHLLLQCPALAQLPACIGTLTNLASLRTLRLDVYASTTFSPNLYALTAVQELFLGVGAVELPTGISTMTGLRTLTIRGQSGATLQALPGDLHRASMSELELVRVTQLARLLPVLPDRTRIVRARRCDLKSIPEGWLMHSRLRALDLNANALTKFPLELLAIKSLELLSLDLNDIRIVPELRIPPTRCLEISLIGNPVERFAKENLPLVEQGLLVR